MTVQEARIEIIKLYLEICDSIIDIDKSIEDINKNLHLDSLKKDELKGKIEICECDIRKDKNLLLPQKPNKLESDTQLYRDAKKSITINAKRLTIKSVIITILIYLFLAVSIWFISLFSDLFQVIKMFLEESIDFINFFIFLIVIGIEVVKEVNLREKKIINRVKELKNTNLKEWNNYNSSFSYYEHRGDRIVDNKTTIEEYRSRLAKLESKIDKDKKEKKNLEAGCLCLKGQLSCLKMKNGIIDKADLENKDMMRFVLKMMETGWSYKDAVIRYENKAGHIRTYKKLDNIEKNVNSVGENVNSVGENVEKYNAEIISRISDVVKNIEIVKNNDIALRQDLAQNKMLNETK